MITRGVKIKVIAFVVISVLGVCYVAVRYVGVGQSLLGQTYSLAADFHTAGGIFTNASVTYRGSPVGKVTRISLTSTGVRVDMSINNGVQIPRDVRAVVTDRSAVGEQYLDLRPNTGAGPYLSPGATIPVSHTGTPPPTETLLVNLDKLVESVDPQELQVVIDELGAAFGNSSNSLERILDDSDNLLATANSDLPETVKLLEDGQTVLATQQASASDIREWAHSLAELTTTIRQSDPDLRTILKDAPPAAEQVSGLLRDVDPQIGALLGNLITVGGIATSRLPGIKQILVVYPLDIAGGFTVTPGDGTVHFGLVLNVDDPPPCQYVRTGESDYKCTSSEQSAGSDVRGYQNAPTPSGPEITPVPDGGAASSSSGSSSSSSSTGSGTATYDPTTGVVLGPDGKPLEFGSTGGQYQLAGDDSWKQLLLAGLEP